MFLQALLFLTVLFPLVAGAENPRLEARVDYYSGQLLGRPYGASPLGEGAGFDADPLVRMDQFDCTTFVETSIALALSGGGETLIPTMNQLRYEHGKVSYQTRNHFTNIDWVKNNAWVLADLTRDLFANEFETLETVISKSAWFAKTVNMSVQIQDQNSLIFYLPFSAIVADPDILQRLPRVSVANVVRKGWNRKPLIGTELDISHQGFIIKKSDGIYFRHASLSKKQTTEQLLVDYIGTYHNSTAVGLQILGFK